MKGPVVCALCVSTFALADFIVGISSDRESVAWWNTRNSRQAAADVFVLAIAKHRVADVEV
jgi:hypothetical protein